MLVPGRFGLVNWQNPTLSVVAEEHAGRIIVLNTAEGLASTLPDALGSGRTYRFYVGVDLTGPATITTKAGDYFVGMALLSVPPTTSDAKHGKHKGSGDEPATAKQTVPCTVTAFHSDPETNTVTLDGTTTGGKKGDCITLIDIGPHEWLAELLLQASAAPASPFSTVTGAKDAHEPAKHEHAGGGHAGHRR
jgi:hypothetical protein